MTSFISVHRRSIRRVSRVDGNSLEVDSVPITQYHVHWNEERRIATCYANVFAQEPGATVMINTNIIIPVNLIPYPFRVGAHPIMAGRRYKCVFR